MSASRSSMRGSRANPNRQHPHRRSAAGRSRPLLHGRAIMPTKADTANDQPEEMEHIPTRTNTAAERLNYRAAAAQLCGSINAVYLWARRGCRIGKKLV